MFRFWWCFLRTLEWLLLSGYIKVTFNISNIILQNNVTLIYVVNGICCFIVFQKKPKQNVLSLVHHLLIRVSGFIKSKKRTHDVVRSSNTRTLLTLVSGSFFLLLNVDTSNPPGKSYDTCSGSQFFGR